MVELQYGREAGWRWGRDGGGGGGEISKVKEAGKFSVFLGNGEKYIWTVGIY